MDGSWIGIVVGTFVLALVARAAANHYRRVHRRAELLRNLDHHDWCRWTHAHRGGSRAVKR
ncbi:hypothetical protein EGY31_33135 [Burkholderia multivorans]|nr:hypothetical protein EGY31_33135 [Burkholderia multivorans]